LAHLHYPIVGDQVYRGRLTLPRGATQPLIEMLRSFKRQALHAAALAFDHPRTGQRLRVESAVPADFAGLLDVLREDARQ
jgi:23S rRNA pseudouridine1911/1915/1917 synthase